MIDSINRLLIESLLESLLTGSINRLLIESLLIDSINKLLIESLLIDSINRDSTRGSINTLY